MPAQCGLWEVGVEDSVKGFIESSFLDWPGKVAAVLFLPGCNFRCPFCHNRDLVLGPDTLKNIPFADVIESVERHKGWVDGVVVTGGEPTVYGGIERLLGRLRDEGLNIKLDTNGSKPETLKRLIEKGLVDAVAMDVKAPLETGYYSKAAGVPVDVPLIRESIHMLAETRLEVTFRATVVPGIHDEAAVRSMVDALHGRRLTLRNFRPGDVLDPKYRLLRPFSPEEFLCLERAAA